MGKVKYRELVNYNPKYHFNHKKPWTSKELEYALDYRNEVKDISLKLGRTINSINQQRRMERFWKEADEQRKIS